MPDQPCGLCGDVQPAVFHLRSRCHITAPLAVRLEGDVLVLSCYVPECGREVARCRVAEWIDPAKETPGHA